MRFIGHQIIHASFIPISDREFALLHDIFQGSAKINQLSCFIRGSIAYTSFFFVVVLALGEDFWTKSIAILRFLALTAAKTAE